MSEVLEANQRAAKLVSDHFVYAHVSDTRCPCSTKVSCSRSTFPNRHCAAVSGQSRSREQILVEESAARRAWKAILLPHRSDDTARGASRYGKRLEKDAGSMGIFASRESRAFCYCARHIDGCSFDESLNR